MLLPRTEHVYCSELFPGKSNKQSKYKSRLYLPLRGGWDFPHNGTFCCLSTLRFFFLSLPQFFNYLSRSLHTQSMKQIPSLYNPEYNSLSALRETVRFVYINSRIWGCSICLTLLLWRNVRAKGKWETSQFCLYLCPSSSDIVCLFWLAIF